MSPLSADTVNDLLRTTARSFYLTLRVLPGAVRQQIGLAYLLARTTDTIADTEIVPLTQRLQALQLLREHFLGSPAGPVDFRDLAEHQGSPAEKILLEKAGASLALLATLSAADLQLVREVLVTITSGQELDLRRFAGAGAGKIAALKTADELEDYTYRVAGCVGEFWTKLCRAHLFPRAELDEAQLVADGIRFGRGLQLVNILRDLPADLKNGRCYLPTDRLAAAGLTPETLLSAGNAGKFLPLYHAYLDEAEAHLAAGWRYTNTLPFSQCRVRLACAWPVLLGARTIQKLRGADPAALQLRVKVSRQEVHGVLLRSLASYPLPCLWRRQFPSAGKLLHQA